jgi:hypothetical protein
MFAPSLTFQNSINIPSPQAKALFFQSLSQQSQPAFSLDISCLNYTSWALQIGRGLCVHIKC